MPFATPRRRPAATAVIALMVALSATACGTSSSTGADSAKDPKGSSGSKGAEDGAKAFAAKPAKEIVDAATRATTAAQSLSVDMKIKAEEGAISGKIALNRASECKGTVTVGKEGTAELLKPKGPIGYMRFDETLLRTQGEFSSDEQRDAVLKVLRGKWVKTDTTKADEKDMLRFCDLDGLLGEWEGDTGTARKEGETTVDGRKAIKLTEVDAGVTYRIYVAAEGTPHILKIEQVGGTEPGTMTFSDFDLPVQAEKPAAKDIIDLDSPTG
ncbi:hypothetical protein [Streptomyces sp. CAU 1734]|uniref:hypothetical protein n=1 Tax=Streptomyces sp. CAU 1734 TaxID=3140360 RepID=UPI00326006E1